MTFPKVILIDNSSFCNLKCSMCDHKNIHKYRKKRIMDFCLYQKIIDEIAKESPSSRVWEIFFGDPFCCPDMGKRVEYAKAQGLTDVVLNSNGLAMSEKNAITMVRAGLDVMYVGIDAITKETYDKIRVGGNFERVVRNVLYYRDCMVRYGNVAQKLFVQFVVCDINEHEVESFIDFWQVRGIGVKIRPRVSWGGLIEAKNLDKAIKRFPCMWAMESMAICADGGVALCAVDLHRQVNCGTVLIDSIQNIWNANLLKYRNMHLLGEYEKLPEFCRGCLDWQSAKCNYKIPNDIKSKNGNISMEKE